MGIRKVSTYEAKIYVGLRHQYLDEVSQLSEIENACQKYVDSVGLCVTVTPTKFIYKGGNESGAIVGLINYPRFPSEVCEVKKHALRIADILRFKVCQYRVTVVASDETIMVGEVKE